MNWSEREKFQRNTCAVKWDYDMTVEAKAEGGLRRRRR